MSVTNNSSMASKSRSGGGGGGKGKAKSSTKPIDSIGSSNEILRTSNGISGMVDNFQRKLKACDAGEKNERETDRQTEGSDFSRNLL